ncbi:MAG: hypothetical protein GXO10_06025 [Crenarchaeota archaeon]|nr:hypothetical protein [Thermoproteota archaeon]
MSLRAPRYDGESILNLSNSILRSFGVPVKYSSLKREIHNQIQNERILLILLDGVVYDKYLEICENDQELRTLYKNTYKIDTVFPSTTPTVLTTLSLAVPPIEHGILGTVLYIREMGILVNTLNVTLHAKHEERDSLTRVGFDLWRITGNISTIFEELSRSCIRSLALIPRGLKGGISRLLYRGAEVQEYSTIGEALIEALNFLDNIDRGLAYIYSSSPDDVAHRRGIESEHYMEALMDILKNIVRIINRRRPRSITLIITTDHGHVETCEKDYIELNKFRRMISKLCAPPYGESRASILLAYERLEDDEDVNMLLNMGFVLYTMRDIVDMGLLGRSENINETVMGNYMMISLSKRCLRYQYNLSEQEKEPLRSMHGSVLPREIEIPLTIVNLY